MPSCCDVATATATVAVGAAPAHCGDVAPLSAAGVEAAAAAAAAAVAAAAAAADGVRAVASNALCGVRP